jgi:peptidoglycan/xylan/chitin deacetylase (PgdA/CDA1 family)
VTGEVLDTLAKYDIKATFFEVGKNIRSHPDITKRVYDEGHLVANHSYNHDYDALYATEESFSTEIKNTEEAIKDATGQDEIFKLIRFPGGSYNAGDHAAEKQIYKKTLANMGYYYCDWNALNGDAEGTTKNAAELIEFFKTSAAQFVTQDKNLIVLMHDSDAKQPTADALETIILYLKDQGYTFHRLDDIDY